MNTQPIASELSYLVLMKQRAERDGDPVPKVKAPTERRIYAGDLSDATNLVGAITEKPTGRSK